MCSTQNRYSTKIDFGGRTHHQNRQPTKSAPFAIIAVPTAAIIEDDGVVAVSRPFSIIALRPSAIIDFY